MPPRHTLDTCRPASLTDRTQEARPASSILCRQSAMEGMPCRTQPSTAWLTLQDEMVIWFKESRVISAMWWTVSSSLPAGRDRYRRPDNSRGERFRLSCSGVSVGERGKQVNEMLYRG